MSEAMRIGSMVAIALGSIASLAHAHPSPAEPPAFFPADCVIVIDKQEQTSWHLDYAVLTDDTEFEVDHVSLEDSKTHQFFALAGTLFARADRHDIMLLDDPEGRIRPMPTWLDASDVTRTAAGVKPEDMTNFTADQVMAQDILANDPVLSSAVRPLAKGTVRVPITEHQATSGVTWDLTEVPPGVYQIAAYIFSPPFNGWAARPGLIKIVDSASDAEEPAAVVLEPIGGRVFAGQGRRVRGCVDAPEGSTFEIGKRAQAEVAGTFEPWIMQPASNGAFELCLENTGLDDALELRVEVRTPAGALAATQSGDAISLFSNPAACVANELLCCPEGASADAGVPKPDASTSMASGGSGAIVDAGSAGVPAEPPMGDASLEQPPSTDQPISAKAPASSCQCRAGTAGWPSARSAAALVLLLCMRSRMGRRQRAA